MPTVTADPANVVEDHWAGRKTSKDNHTTLWPGRYDWIEVPKGNVTFEPGVYVIRRTRNETGLALYIQGDNVIADGVMFYITDSRDYHLSNGLPDAGDGENSPATVASTTLMPSTVIDVGPNSRFSPLNDLNSPFHGMQLFQRRLDRRPIVIRNVWANSSVSFSGCIYSKWGHVIFANAGTSDTRFVAGSMRIINLGNCRIAPSQLLPPAEDVFLIE